MSASAFISTPGKLYMVSDGAGYSLSENSEIISKTTRKIWKLRQSTGLIWMGTRPHGIDQIVQSVYGLDAESAINTVAAILKAGLTNNQTALDSLNNNRPYGVFTFECQNGFTEYYRLIYHIDRFTPCYKGKLKPGAVGTMVVDQDSTPFEALLDKYTSPGETVFDVVKKAFTEMVEQYKDEGLPVGGCYYMEILKSNRKE